MKKLIVSLVIFLALIGVSVYEIVLTSNTFEKLEQLSEAAQTNISLCVEYKQNAEKEREKSGVESKSIKTEFETAQETALIRIAEIEKYWQKRKPGAMFFGNHNITKSTDERITTLKAQAQCGQWEDASASAAALRIYFRDLKDDTHPALSNLF